MEVPINVNTSKRTKSLPLQRCYQYRDANHLVQDCPHYIDVRQFILEQRKELIEDLLVLKNTVPVEETCPPKKEDFA